MKLFGSGRGRRKKAAANKHDIIGPDSRADNSSARGKTELERARIDRMVAEYRRKKRRRRAASLVILLALILGGAAAWSLWVKPPDTGGKGPTLAGDTPPGGQTEAPSETLMPSEAYDAGARRKFSFVILGEDDEAKLTDTILVGMFDAQNHKLNIVNIPRDTLVNVSWTRKKANSLYKNSDGIETFTGVYLRDLLGFEVDMWAIISLDAFVELIDCIGGVDFDVPIDMVYEDLDQNLIISIGKGYHHLDGESALKVVRFRTGVNDTGYPDGDIGRIKTQHDFLGAVASQVLQFGNIPKINEFIKIFEEHVDTNLTARNAAYFAQEYLRLSVNDITFGTMPGNYYCTINGVSYCSVYLDEWIEMINEYLNPYDERVTVNHLNILRWDDLSGAYSTTGEVAGGADSIG